MMIYGATRVAPEKAVFRPALSMSFLPGVTETKMKLPASHATEVFINLDGDLSIQQDQTRNDEGIVTVALTREQARLVAQEIMRLDADDAFGEGEE